MARLALGEIRWDRHGRAPHLRNQSKFFCRRKALCQPIDEFRECNSLLPDNEIFVILRFFHFHASVLSEVSSLVTHHPSPLFQSAQSQPSIRSSFAMSSAKIAERYFLSSGVIARSYGTTFRSLLRILPSDFTPRK